MNIKVFGMTNCAGCVTVKSVLEQRGVEYEYFDVNHHADMEEAMKHNIRSVPTTVITHGDHSYETIVGSSPEQLKIILQSVGV